MRKYIFLLLFSFAFLSPATSPGQPDDSRPACSLPVPAFSINRPNIFSLEQEQWLGDAQAREEEPDYILLPEKDSGELARIGQKMLAQLPPTPIRYHFRVYESEDANAFSGPGGYVYVSRKLITDLHNEDELAGVLAHEIGHIYTHQVATVYTRWFKVRMNVTSLGGEDDVNDKLQQLLNVHRKTNEDQSEDQEDKDEFLADRVGMYAMVRAGYAPRAFAECLDRISGNKGRLGSFLTDMLDINSLETRRVRAARSLSNELPAACKSQPVTATPEFKDFQQQIRAVPVHSLVPPSPGLQAFKLDPPVRTALDQVRFSPNGQLVLAQNETAIHVLSRAPLKLLFSIDAPGARPAHFTPDSRQVVFDFPSMRVERWDVASGKRKEFFELVDYRGCQQTSLSPDGKTLTCLAMGSAGVWVKMMDVDTGKLFYDNKNFYGPGFMEMLAPIIRAAGAVQIGTIAYSPDGRVMIIATGGGSQAFDLFQRKRIGMSGQLTNLSQVEMAFVDSDKLVFTCGTGPVKPDGSYTFKMCESTFPDGNPIHTFQLGQQWIDPVAHGSRILIGPMRDNAVALVDPSTGIASAAFKLDALDLYDQAFASETAGGGVTVGDLAGGKAEQVELPVSPLRDLPAADFSPDGRFLAFSNRSRSAIWDLKTQKRVALMRPFQGVRFEGNDQMFAQYQNSHSKPGQNSHIDLVTGKATEGAKFDAKQKQVGNVLVSFRPMDKFTDGTDNTEMDVFDLTTGTQLWTRRFKHETPALRKIDGDGLLLIMDLAEQTAQDDTGHSGDKFEKASDKLGEWIQKGLLVELLDSRTGAVKRQIALPQPHYWDQYNDRRSAVLYGDFLVVRGNYNNSTIYRLADGKRMGAFFGRAIAGDGKLGLIAATNDDQEVILLDANTGRELKRVNVDQFPMAARIIPASNSLLVLTAGQSVYSIELPQTAAVPTAGK
jgi:WD40 repeat protein